MYTRHTTSALATPLLLLCITLVACGADAGSESYSDWGGADSSALEGGSSSTEDAIPAGQLTAGRWDDHADWDYWLNLTDTTSSWYTSIEPWGMRPAHRIRVTVESAQGEAHDHPVQLIDEEGGVLWSARTDRHGVAYLFPTLSMEAQPSTSSLLLKSGPSSVAVDLTTTSSYTLTLDTHVSPAPVLDVMFMIDVTSSMLDEQSYLRAELKDVITRLEARHEDINLRLSMNFYCDPSDEFSVHAAPFETPTQGFERLERGDSCGGGDYEEGVDEGLEEALKQSWSDSARARVLFLVLDAPPHRDAQGIARLQRFATQASARGIRLVPIVASGADKPLEFLLRSLTISTHGIYVFLTGHSGIGDDKLEPTIGKYRVELLNQLLLDVLSEYASPAP